MVIVVKLDELSTLNVKLFWVNMISFTLLADPHSLLILILLCSLVLPLCSSLLLLPPPFSLSPPLDSKSNALTPHPSPYPSILPSSLPRHHSFFYLSSSNDLLPPPSSSLILPIPCLVHPTSSLLTSRSSSYFITSLLRKRLISRFMHNDGWFVITLGSIILIIVLITLGRG